MPYDFLGYFLAIYRAESRITMYMTDLTAFSNEHGYHRLQNIEVPARKTSQSSDSVELNMRTLQ